MSTCGASPFGGRRRRSRKMRGGNGYGFGKPISVGAMEVVPNMTSVPDGAAYKPIGGRRRKSRKTRRRGGYEVSAPPDPDMMTQSQCPAPNTWSPTSFKDVSGGVLGYCRDPNGFQVSIKGKHAGRRRKSRKTRRRSMRGGGSVANVGYGFTGDGARGLANQTGYPSNLPPGGDFAIPTGTR
jgi:hypothetical protein